MRVGFYLALFHYTLGNCQLGNDSKAYTLRGGYSMKKLVWGVALMLVLAIICSSLATTSLAAEMTTAAVNYGFMLVILVCIILIIMLW